MPTPETLSEEGYQLKLLKDAPHTEYGKALFREIQEMFNEAQRAYNDKAIVSDEDVKKDFRYLKGVVHALQRVLQIPEKAQKKFIKTYP